MLLGALVDKARPKVAKNQYAKPRWLTERAIKEEAKIVLKLPYLARWRVFIKS